MKAYYICVYICLVRGCYVCACAHLCVLHTDVHTHIHNIHAPSIYMYTHTHARTHARTRTIPSCVLSDGTARMRAFFGQGTGPLYLDNVQCLGTEEHILDCPSSASGLRFCAHFEDAGVQCAGILPLLCVCLYNVYVRRKVRIRTILGFSCANLGS